MDVRGKECAHEGISYTCKRSNAARENRVPKTYVKGGGTERLSVVKFKRLSPEL